MAPLQPHVDRHAILGFEKQFHAHDVIGDASWWVNLDEGTIVFGGELEMGAALLGTEASGTWLWGWANPGGFPEPVIAAGLAAYEYGSEHDLRALLAPESALSEDVSLDRIAIVVTGALGLPATYTGPLDEDARILIGLEHPSLELPPSDPARLVTVLSAVLQSGVVADWRVALDAYRGPSALDGVEIELDEAGRVRSLRA